MTTIEELQHVLDALLDAEEEYVQAVESQKNFIIEHDRPIMPEWFDNLEDYATWKGKNLAYHDEKTRLVDEVEYARSRFKSAEIATLATLPDRVWFHFRDSAISIEKDREIVRIIPWPKDVSKLPSLKD